MRVVEVSGTEYKCPRYLVRSKNGWQTRIPGDASAFFSDKKCGGVAQAHAAALSSLTKRLSDLGKPVVTESVFRTQEHPQKARPTGIPGVYLFHRPARGRRAAETELQIRIPGLPIRTLYVGSVSTWKQRLQSKLVDAQRIRGEMKLQRIQAMAGPETRITPAVATKSRAGQATFVLS